MWVCVVFFILRMLTVLEGTHWWSLEWLEAPTAPSPPPPPPSPLNDINNRDFVNHPVRKYSNGFHRFSWNIPDKKTKKTNKLVSKMKMSSQNKKRKRNSSLRGDSIRQ